MIVRDKYGIIVQHRPGDPSYMDGGDSSRSQGISAMVGITQLEEYAEYNFGLCNAFVYPSGRCVRHPHQIEYNDPALFSRDQLLCLVMGLGPSTAKRVHDAYRGAGWFVNKDWLSPSHRLHLMGRALVAPTLWQYFTGRLFLLGDVLWHRWVMPSREQNQVICQVVEAGPQWVKFYKKCSLFDWKRPVLEYWSGWRDQHEIGEAMVKLLEEYL